MGQILCIRFGDNYKVKRLVINPNKSISMQRHFKREELWQVVSGYGIMKVSGTSEYIQHQGIFHISRGGWHKVTNTSDKNQLVIIEIQTGICEEDDIERK